MKKYNLDPFDVTVYERSEEELQAFLMFCIAVAGKTAVVIAQKMESFLERAEMLYGIGAWAHFRSKCPFALLRYMNVHGHLTEMIQHEKLGKNSLLTKAFSQFADMHAKGMSLKTITVDELENVHGIGSKTSRFFLLHSRPEQQVAVLDTHILHYLRDNGYDAPKNTPASKTKYAELEKVVLRLAKKSRKTVADFDLDIWKKYTKTKPLAAA